jgi:hypothetical protein
MTHQAPVNAIAPNDKINIDLILGTDNNSQRHIELYFATSASEDSGKPKRRRDQRVTAVYGENANRHKVAGVSGIIAWRRDLPTACLPAIRAAARQDALDGIARPP